RHMNAMHFATRHLLRSLPWAAALLLFWFAASAFAQDEADPPARVAHMAVREGSVVFAPHGEEEWVALPQNRPLTTGDRVWTDRGARAELQLGSATVHIGNESHLGFSALDERVAQFLLQQGSLNARVRELTQGENFEIGTPHLALRALQPGDYRIDVAPDGRETRVTVASGVAQVFGEGGQSVHLSAGQQASFAGRSLAQVNGSRLGSDEFGAWAAARNRAEDQALAARYVPRGVVGATQLDAHGTWSQDPGLGAVWFPQVTVQDWAPYRYGRWEWIQPWGWTWIDDAPWGFAPFHYGRWTMIADRWAWVPGRMAARPVYSPALVVFAGGEGTHFSIGAGPAVAWYPLAPGEAWWPAYRSSPRYVNFANFNINLNAYPRHYGNHVWRQRPHAITAVREDDFRRGRPVYRHWQPVQPQAIHRAQIGVVPARPEWRRERERDADRVGDRRAVPQLRAAGATFQPDARRFDRGDVPPAVREQYRAGREQDRLQRDAERDARRQMRDAEEARRDSDPRFQREQVLRQQQAAPLRRDGEPRREADGRRDGRGDGRLQREDGDGRGRGWQR
ncbi:MAG TPA: DUF6600 domain-containing protein, partial [Ramlibacter sp.]|nr:DUF6600 domain-containing protein [Ramlibacter sp.]